MTAIDAPTEPVGKQVFREKEKPDMTIKTTAPKIIPSHPFGRRLGVGLALMLLTSALSATPFRNNLSVDLVGLGQAHPNVSFERSLGNHMSLGADFSFDALNIDDGVVLTPQIRFYPVGVLREGFLLQAGVRLPSEDDILAEAGLGYAFWVDRMHLTPVGKIRHDGSWQLRLELGYGWF